MRAALTPDPGKSRRFDMLYKTNWEETKEKFTNYWN